MAKNITVDRRTLVTIADYMNRETMQASVNLDHYETWASAMACGRELPRVGEKAWVHSRGRWYLGLVQKVTKTKVHVAYVSPGAITSAKKYGYHTPEATLIPAPFNMVMVAFN